MVSDTLYPKEDTKLFHHKECLTRKCSDCDVMGEEKKTSNEVLVVKWRKFEYVSLGTTEDGQQKKRLQLVDKSTSPGEMFTYLPSLFRVTPPISSEPTGKISSSKTLLTTSLLAMHVQSMTIQRITPVYFDTSFSPCISPKHKYPYILPFFTDTL